MPAPGQRQQLQLDIAVQQQAAAEEPAWLRDWLAAHPKPHQVRAGGRRLVEALVAAEGQAHTDLLQALLQQDAAALQALVARASDEELLSLLQASLR